MHGRSIRSTKHTEYMYFCSDAQMIQRPCHTLIVLSSCHPVIPPIRRPSEGQSGLGYAAAVRLDEAETTGQRTHGATQSGGIDQLIRLFFLSFNHAQSALSVGSGSCPHGLPGTEHRPNWSRCSGMTHDWEKWSDGYLIREGVRHAIGIFSMWGLFGKRGLATFRIDRWACSGGSILFRLIVWLPEERREKRNEAGRWMKNSPNAVCTRLV